MLIVVLIVVWIAVLSPIAYRRFRDRDTDRSIVNFHERMAHLTNGEPLVAPAHRLDVSDEAPPREPSEYEMRPPTRVPQLRIVPVDATPGELERDMSWADWSVAHSDEPYEPTGPVRRAEPVVNHRVAAYSHQPTAQILAPPTMSSANGSKAQRVRRRNVLLTLVGSVFLTTVAALFTNALLFEVVALVSWIALATFLGLMYYAMTTGLISTAPSAAPRISNVRAMPTRRDPAYEAAESEGSFAARWSDQDDQRYAHAQ